jgi:sigma-B regulation protein RsbQ
MLQKIQDKYQVNVVRGGSMPILFGNGFGTSQKVWKPVIELLGPEYTAITYEYAGGSPSTVNLYSNARHATYYGFVEDLLELIDGLDIGSLTYVGHSMGGMIGLLGALAEPEIFKKLILVGSSARYVDDPQSGYRGGFTKEQLDQLLAAMQTDYSAWANGFSAAAMGNPDLADLSADFSHSLKSLRADMAFRILRTAFMSDHRMEVDAFSRLEKPCCVVQSSHDLAVSADAAKWLAQNASAQYVGLQIEGHFPHIVNPQVIANIVRDFVPTHEF